MLNYSCRVIDSLGEIREIDLTAPNSSNLKDIISKQGMTLLSFKKSGKFRGIKLNKNDVINFTQTLSLLLNSNLTLKDALNVSLTTFKKSNIKTLIDIIIKGIKKGETFSSILKNSALGFPPMYIGLIQVGEKTGTLNSVLSHLNSYLNRNKKIQSKLQLALIYPGFIISIGMIFSLLFVTVILPKFYEMFSSLGADISVILRERGEIFTKIVFIMFILIFISSLFFLWIKKIGKKDPKKSAPFDRFLIKLPKIGDLILENQSLNLIFALNVLTDSSLTIEESLTYSRDVLTNTYLILEVERIKNQIISGESLSLAFSKGAFPNKISAYIKVGEKTGDINQIFDKLSDYYLVETNKKIDLFMAIIEPMFILIVGVSLITLLNLFIVPILTNLGGLI